MAWTARQGTVRRCLRWPKRTHTRPVAELEYRLNRSRLSTTNPTAAFPLKEHDLSSTLSGFATNHQNDVLTNERHLLDILLVLKFHPQDVNCHLIICVKKKKTFSSYFLDFTMTAMKTVKFNADAQGKHQKLGKNNTSAIQSSGYSNGSIGSNKAGRGKCQVRWDDTSSLQLIR